MVLRLGDTAPNFTAQTTEGEINFHEWIGDSWAVLFSHPQDFTPVCTTELGAAARMKPKFYARNVKLIALSIDSLEDHQKWIEEINNSQSCTVNFPIIADSNKNIAEKYGMINPELDQTRTARSLFVIGPDKNVQMMMTYPMASGRDFNEILRVIESLQRAAEHKVVTPANWVPGQDVIVDPNVPDAEARKLFPQGFKTVTNYLRLVKDPAKNKDRANKAA